MQARSLLGGWTMTRTEPKSHDFGSFEPGIVTPAHEPLRREAFRGKDPCEAALIIAEAHAQRVHLEPISKRQKEVVVRGVLDAIAAKGHDLATVDGPTMAAYREWLRQRVARRDISESYAGHIAIQWNATIRAVFGEEATRDLRIKGFRQHAKRIVRRGPDDMFVLVGAAGRIRCRSEDDKQAFLCYLELAWPTAGRAGSLLKETLTFAHVNWQQGT